MKKLFIFTSITFIALLAAACSNTQNTLCKTVTAEETAALDSAWNRQFDNAEGIIALYDSIKQATPQEKEGVHLLNQCHYVWQSGEYMFRCRGKNSDIHQLPKHCTALSLEDENVLTFASGKKIGKFIDHYFTLQAMQKGDNFEASRDGVTATVFFHIRPLNDNDYNKLRVIFSSKNEKLHNEYLERLKFPLQNSGCTEGLKSIQPLIEMNVADSPLKAEVLAMYETFTRMTPGNPAPLSTLKDTDGNEHTFADFKGKVLVIDVWATWCSSCIKNMPKFISLAAEYAHCNDVKFITISVDRSEEKELWLQTIKKNGMSHLLNLFPDCDVQSQFETDFQIQSVPRYIVIDKQGKIVLAHAPSEPSELRNIIEQHL